MALPCQQVPAALALVAEFSQIAFEQLCEPFMEWAAEIVDSRSNFFGQLNFFTTSSLFQLRWIKGLHRAQTVSEQKSGFLAKSREATTRPYQANKLASL